MTTKDQAALAKLYTESFTNGESGNIDLNSIYNTLTNIMADLEESGLFGEENTVIYEHLKPVLDIIGKRLPKSKFSHPNDYILDRQ